MQIYHNNTFSFIFHRHMTIAYDGSDFTLKPRLMNMELNEDPWHSSCLGQTLEHWLWNMCVFMGLQLHCKDTRPTLNYTNYISQFVHVIPTPRTWIFFLTSLKVREGWNFYWVILESWIYAPLPCMLSACSKVLVGW